MEMKLFKISLMVAALLGAVWVSAPPPSVPIAEAQFGFGKGRMPRKSVPPTCNSSKKGHIYYDTDDDAFLGCNGSDWRTLGSALAGQTFFPDGTLALPSITNEGDPNTGVHFPSADSLGFTVGGNDLGTWKVAVGTLTATQVRKLNATPVEVIAAPGSGLSIAVDSVQLHFDYGGTVYDNVGAGEDIACLYVTDGSRAQVEDCDNLSCVVGGGTADDYGLMSSGTFAGSAFELNDNDAVELFILSGEWATTDDDSDGNSPIHYLIRYRVVTLDLS